jgi:hypothetical protein
MTRKNKLPYLISIHSLDVELCRQTNEVKCPLPNTFTMTMHEKKKKKKKNKKNKKKKKKKKCLV